MSPLASILRVEVAFFHFSSSVISKYDTNLNIVLIISKTMFFHTEIRIKRRQLQSVFMALFNFWFHKLGETLTASSVSRRRSVSGLSRFLRTLDESISSICRIH